MSLSSNEIVLEFKCRNLILRSRMFVARGTDVKIAAQILNLVYWK